MRDFLHELKNFFRKGDMVLLIMCLSTSAFGCLIIASTNNYRGFTRYVLIQVAAILLGVLFFAIASSIDADFFSEHRLVLTGICVGMLLLLIPFGTDLDTGNRSWLDFPFLPIDIQPAEICKVLFILIMASVMASHQNRISHPGSVIHMGAYLVIVVGTNMLISRDLGVSLIFVFIFIGMAFAGGVRLFWFAASGGLVAAAFPVLWTKFFTQTQKNRILVLFDPSIDPNGINERYHAVRSLKSLTGGGMLGQGLFNGNRTQSGQLFAQHTDFIFSAIGEEMGFVGCILVMLMLIAIVARCIWVGRQSNDYMRRLICYGAASALIFQIVSNVGMCMGITPVIGLTLPFISYGGSSTVSLYAMLGLVSGVCARPAPKKHELYIRPR